ncbi:MAG: hydantoinase/oxoprolinase family protein [Pseudomonadales bacterium]|nr:hydantoinase/oxoprolinase family protein [Pseudomonadales bacterium]
MTDAFSKDSVLWLGVDTGGTFTDLVLVSEHGLLTSKILSTPEAPERAILEGIRVLGVADAVARGAVRIVHGTTVATNAALERKGVRTAYLTNAGLADVLTLGRQDRAALHELTPAVVEPPVPPELCVEVSARLDAQGREISPLRPEELEALVAQLRRLAPEAVAINLLYAWLDDRQERELETALRAALGPELFLTRSSFVLPEYREYERGIATWLNAWLGPRVQGYLDRLARALAPSRIAVMQSSGGTMDASVAAGRAVNLLLSGPAGGVAGARRIASLAGVDRLLSFDMGGTSTDVALIEEAPSLAAASRIGPWPIAVPMLDIHTIGAGGGSIARVDAGGALQVGPESAGADPGPACYGRGGEAATVTDAHVVLGHLPAEEALGGTLALDASAAWRAVGRLADALGTDPVSAARGILRIADEHMAQALRVMSIERGQDPRRFTLCCFGGAGGLHLCALAERLGMNEALVPAQAGLLSALGMLMAAPERQLARTLRQTLSSLEEATIQGHLAALRAQGIAELTDEGHGASGWESDYSADLRYEGQAFALRLPMAIGDARATLAERFRALHEQSYGHALDAPVELVTLRARIGARHQPPALPRRATGPDAAPKGHLAIAGQDVPVPAYAQALLVRGQQLEGPALVLDQNSTTWIGPGWTARMDDYGSLRLTRAREAPAAADAAAGRKIT